MKVNFDITTKCNAKCPLCARELKRYSSRLNKNMSFEQFEEIVNQNNQFNLMDGKFCGELGDPLMHNDIDKFIDFGCKIFKRITIHTNGGIRTGNWYENVMKKHSNLYFEFGIDGITQDINSKYRKNVNTKLALNNMFKCANIDPKRITWAFTKFPHNIHQVNEHIMICKKLGINSTLRENYHDDIRNNIHVGKFHDTM